MKKKLKSNFSKNILIMFSGSIFSQIILVATSPFLTRIYTPYEIGQFTIFLTITTILLPILNGRFDILIVSARKKEEANTLVSLSIIISLILLIVISLLVVFLSFHNIKVLNLDFIYLYFVIPFMILGSLNNILTSYMNRLKRYNLMSNVLILRSSIQSTLQILLGILSFSIIGLILSYVISFFGGLIIQYKEFKKNYKFVFNKMILNSFLINKDQILYSAPSVLANGLSHSLIIFFIASLYTSAEVGMYSITIRVLGLPLAIIALSFSKVFYEKANDDYYKHGQFKGILIKTTLILSSISIPFFLIIAFLSPSVFPFVFGKEWTEAGKYIIYLVPMYIVRLIVSSISLSIIVIAKQKAELLLQVSFILSCVIIYFVTKILLLDIYTFLTLISVFFSINYVAFYIYIYMNSKNKEHNSI